MKNIILTIKNDVVEISNSCFIFIYDKSTNMTGLQCNYSESSKEYKNLKARLFAIVDIIESLENL